MPHHLPPQIIIIVIPVLLSGLVSIRSAVRPAGRGRGRRGGRSGSTPDLGPVHLIVPDGAAPLVDVVEDAERASELVALAPRRPLLRGVSVFGYGRVIDIRPVDSRVGWITLSLVGVAARVHLQADVTVFPHIKKIGIGSSLGVAGSVYEPLAGQYELAPTQIMIVRLSRWRRALPIGWRRRLSGARRRW
jgi:hypothetical protein